MHPSAVTPDIVPYRPSNQLIGGRDLVTPSDGAPRPFGRTWFAIDGSREPTALPRPDTYRIPDELARTVLEKYSSPDDVVLDPYAGTGSIVLAAQSMGRVAIGVERDGDRFRYLESQLLAPSAMIHSDFPPNPDIDLPQADLVFTSPPSHIFGGWDEEIGYVSYWEEVERAFERLLSVIKLGGLLIVEMANHREGSLIRPNAFELALRLCRNYLFSEEFVRCNTGPEFAAPDSYHSYVLVFRNTRTKRRTIQDVIAEDYF